jgi:hypothetical protein
MHDELRSRIAEVMRTTAQAWGLPSRPRRTLLLVAV